MTNPLSLRVTLAVVVVQLLFFGLRYMFNGTLGLAMASLADYGDTASGFYVLDEGINVIFRMDLTGMVAALSVTWGQLRAFVAVNTVLFLLLSPLRVGAMEVYWGMTRGDKDGKLAQVLQWYAQRARMFKAWVVEFCLQGLVGAITFAATIPSLYLFYRFYSTTTSVAGVDFSRRLLLWSAEILAILAMLLGIWIHSLFLPVRYCLASHPEYSLGETFRRGFRSARGVRGGFYRFRLSYLLWFFVSKVTYGAMDLFVLPYSSLGSMLYLQEAARQRNQKPEPVPAEQEAPSHADWYEGAAWPPVEAGGEPEDNAPPVVEVPETADAPETVNDPETIETDDTGDEREGDE